MAVPIIHRYSGRIAMRPCMVRASGHRAVHVLVTTAWAARKAKDPGTVEVPGSWYIKHLSDWILY